METFAMALQMIKTNSSYLIRKEYKSLMGSKGKNGAKDWTEKMENGLISSFWVMGLPLSQSAIPGKLGMESKCCPLDFLLYVGRVTFNGKGLN